MNKIVKTISTTMVICAMLVSAFHAPVISVANAQTTSGFGFNLPGFDFSLPDFDFSSNETTSESTSSASTGSTQIQECDLDADVTRIETGGSVNLSWDTSGFDIIKLNGQTLNGSDGTIQMTDILQNTTYTLLAETADGTSNCLATVQIVCVPPPPAECRLEVHKVVDKATAHVGDTLTYTITVKNTGDGDCTGGGVKIEDVVSDKLTYLTHSVSSNLTAGYGSTPVYTAGDRTLHFNGNTLTPNEQGTITWTGRVNTPSSCGDFEVPNQAKATAKELNNFNTWVYSQTVKTQIDNDCVENPAPSCDSFTATPGSIVVGGNATLAWQTSHATRVVINNGVGEVALDGSVSVSPLTTTTYQLTAFGTDNRSVNCSVPVTVTTTNTAPICEYFTATPNSFGVGGGQVTLNWKVLNATNVSISPTIGTVLSQGSQVTNVTGSTNFVLTATDADGEQVSCGAPVTVANDPVLTCQDNVSFTASDYSIDEGDDTTLNWSTTNVDSVSISVINATALSGSRTVDPRSDTTYVLTATKGSKSVACPLRIEVDEDRGGGGGGGTPTPRCELTISDNKIKAGEQITLRWDTSNATEVTIKDNRGKTIMSTEKYLSKDKKDYYDGSIKLRPTRDTEYTLVAERGSKDRTCKVKVDVEDLTVITDRQPLVAGISLSNVPYTGFEAGTILTIFFYTLLALWALFVTYLIVVRPRMAAGVAGGAATEFVPVNTAAMMQAEAIRPDLFTPTVVAATATVPANLPTGTPVIGYENMPEGAVHQVTDATMTALENRAHSQKALLSSDAVRHFIATTEGTVERNEALDEVIAEAKSLYPLEDGWIVINEARMRSLCDTCVVNQTASQSAPYIPTTVPAGSGSLAEAIVTGNIVAAYEMIGNRPMFALADAAADLDAVVRGRRGEVTKISNLLATETAALSEEKIKNMIAALTGALDGTYTDEASAVKMAIMKAVKEVA